MIKTMRYTKNNGEASTRQVLVITRPRKTYLTYDVSNLSEKALEVLLKAHEQIEEFRTNAMLDFELLTGIKQASLWRSFKPEQSPRKKRPGDRPGRRNEHGRNRRRAVGCRFLGGQY